MRLAAKLMLVLLTVVVLLTAAGSYLSVRRAFERMQREQEQLVQDAAASHANRLADAWRSGGAEAMLEELRRLQDPESPHQIRWVWFEKTEVAGGLSRRVVERLSIPGVEVVTTTTTDRDGTRSLRTLRPLDLGDGVRGGLEVTGSLETLDARTREAVLFTLTTLGLVALASVAVVYVAGVFWVGKPLDQLIAKTERIAGGDFSRPLPVRGGDELSQLARALNSMCEQLAAQQQRIQEEAAGRLATLEQLRHADRLKTVGRLAAGLAHELGTPLNVIAGRAGLIASGKLSHQETADSARAIKVEADRVTGIIRQLLDFARPSTARRTLLDLGRLLRDTCALLEPLAEKRGAVFHSDLPEGVVVSADRSQLQQVFTNILVNAVQSMPRGGDVRITLESREAAPPDGGRSGPFALVSIRDQGPGIKAEHLPHLFEPFFTTKDVGEGTGLGLSIAYGIVQEHGGWIGCDSQPGQGACFRVYLPRSDAA